VERYFLLRRPTLMVFVWTTLPVFGFTAWSFSAERWAESPKNSLAVLPAMSSDVSAGARKRYRISQGQAQAAPCDPPPKLKPPW